jgi:hypothetical protein
MFDIDTSHLPGTTTYRGAENIFNRHHTDLVKGRREHRFWSDNCVPLRDRRSEHLYVYKSKGTYSFCLYNTPAVQWIDDNTVFVDVLYNTQSTYAFARRFIPFNVYSYKGQPCIMWATGQLVKDRGTFRRNEAGVWEPAGTYNKPTKQVVDKEAVKEINAQLKPLFDYIRQMWIIAGQNPFMNLRETVGTDWFGANAYFSAYRNNIPDMTSVDNRLACIAAVNPRFGRRGVLYTLEKLIKEIREAAYRYSGGYKDVNYDE